MEYSCEIEKVVAVSDDFYELKFKLYKGLLPYFQEFLNNMENMAVELHRKARIAEQRSEKRIAAHRMEVEKRDKLILERIRSAYAVAFDETRNIRLALKVINRNFKDWIWIRVKFKKEIEAKRDLEIIRLINKGLTSKEVGFKLGLHPGTVRKIILHFSETGV